MHYTPESACSPFKIKTAVESHEFPYMLLVETGTCNIRLKALNAEHAGAKLMIVIRSQEEDHKELIDESFDTLAMMVEIPTLTIGKKEGEKLKNLIRTTGDVNLKFQMPIPQSNTVDVKLFIKDNDLNFYQFIRNLKSYIVQFEEELNLSVHFYKTADNRDAQDKAKLEATANCMDIDNIFDLMALYGESCAALEKYTPQCLREQASSLDRKAFLNFERCVSNLTESDIAAVGKQMKQQKRNSRSHLMINDKLYHGSIKPENVFEAICGAFIKSPDNCMFLNNKYTSVLKYSEFKRQSRSNRTFVIAVNIIVLVFLLAMAGMAMVLIFGKIYQRILNERVAAMVKDSISNYRTLKDNV